MSFTDVFNLHKEGPLMSRAPDGETVVEFDAAIVGQRQLKRISWEFISIMFTLILQLAVIIWWASGITNRVDTIEKNRNTSAQGAVRDIQIGMLMKIAEENSRVHEAQNIKIDKIIQQIADVGHDVAAIKGEHRGQRKNGYITIP